MSGSPNDHPREVPAVTHHPQALPPFQPGRRARSESFQVTAITPTDRHLTGYQPRQGRHTPLHPPPCTG